MGRPRKKGISPQNLEKQDIMHWDANSKSQTLPPAKLRYDQSNHFPIRMLKTKAMYCLHDGCIKQTVFRCLKCNVPLCIGTRESTNCFYTFHIKTVVNQENVKKIEEEPDLQVVEFDDPLNVEATENNTSSFNVNINKLPKQPFVLLSKLNLSPMSSVSSCGDTQLSNSNEQNDFTNDSNEMGQTPIRGRSGRAIKPKLDPNFKYLPAGAKKHALNFGIASQANDIQRQKSKENAKIKPKKMLNSFIKKPKHIPLVPLSIKTVDETNTTSMPRTFKSGRIKKRKLKPLNSISSRYLKIRRNKYKTDNLLQRSSTLVPSHTTPSHTQTQDVKPSPIVLNTFNSANSNYQYPVEESKETNFEPQQFSMYALQTFDHVSSPEAILPDDAPSHQFNVIGNFVRGLSHNCYQNDDIKEEPIEICDNGYTFPTGEAVLDFTMF